MLQYLDLIVEGGRDQCKLQRVAKWDQRQVLIKHTQVGLCKRDSVKKLMLDQSYISRHTEQNGTELGQIFFSASLTIICIRTMSSERMCDRGAVPMHSPTADRSNSYQNSVICPSA